MKKSTLVCLIAAAVAVGAAFALVWAYREKMTELMEKACRIAKMYSDKALKAVEKPAEVPAEEETAPVEEVNA